MTITISVDNNRSTLSSDGLILDESAGVQTPGGTDDGNDVDVTVVGGALAGLDASFLAYLNGLNLSTAQKSYAASVDGASSAVDFVKVTASAGEKVSDLYFSDASGNPLQGAAIMIDHDNNAATPKVALQTLDGEALYLWSFGDYAIATTDPTSAIAGDVVAAFYLKQSGDNLTAQVQMVTFEPLKHPNGSDPDDAVNFTDVLQVSASATLSFKFDTLESGNFLWAAVGTFQGGLLVTGQDLNVNDNPGGKQGDMVKGGADSSDSVNTSQGGLGATIGINAQHFTDGPKENGADTVGPTAVFTMVTGYEPLKSPATPGQATGTNVKQIDYGNYINSPGAAIFISQTTSNGAATMKISLLEAGGGGVDVAPSFLAPEEGYGLSGYIGDQDLDTNLTDDTEVNVGTVTIRGQTWSYDEAGIASGITKAGIKVTISGNEIIVAGVTSGDTIKFTALDSAASSVDGTFNRFTVQGLPGTADFDIGRVDVDKGIVFSQGVGDKLLVEDDGPALSSLTITKKVVEDALSAAAGDGDQSTGISDGDNELDEVNFTNADLQTVVTSGTDQPAEFDLNLAVNGQTVRDIDGNALFSKGQAMTWSVSGGVVSAVAGGRTVFTITQSAGDTTATPTDDIFRVDLRDQIDHPTGSGETGIETVNITPAFTAKDRDGDAVALTGTQIRLEVENDVPAVNNNIASIQVDEDALTAASGDLSTGIVEVNDGDGGPENDVAVWTNADLQNVVDTGADEGVTFALNTSLGGPLDGAAVLGIDGQPVFSNGEQLFYNVNGNIVEGVAGNRVVFTIAQTSGSGTASDPSDDAFTFNLKDQIDHADASGDLGARALNLTAAFTATDRDGDPADLNGAADDKMPIQVTIENDVPALSGQTITKKVVEDALSAAAGDGDQSTGISDGDNEPDEVNFTNADLQTVVSPGADEQAVFDLNLAVNGQTVRDIDGNALFSKGQAITWSVSGGVVSAVAGGRTVFTITQSAGDATATPTDDVFRVDLRDQIDHPSGSGETFIETVNITPAFTAKDRDGDAVALTGTQIRLDVENDVPAITAQILSSLVEFANDSTGTVTRSLNGAVGGDENGATSTSATGALQYTITSFNTPKNVYSDLEGVLSADKTKVTYYSTSVDADQNSNTAVYELALGQTGAGSYTFTVLKPPPLMREEFDFTDLPSGQNLFGVIAADKQNLDGLALFVTSKNADVNNSTGAMLQTSGTVNTSKGGGPVTIGDSNQMYDPGEGAFFAYLKDADVPSIAGINGGLNQNSADDADTVGFKDTVGVKTASVDLVQVQGTDPATLRITAYDIRMDAYAANGLQGVDSDAEARGFVEAPEANADLVSIKGVRVYVGGRLVESWIDSNSDGTLERQDVNKDGVVNAADDDPNVNVVLIPLGNGIYSAQVSGLTIGVNASGSKVATRVEFDTVEEHDLALIDAIAGKYDIGGFNVSQGEDVPDQLFNFSVAITDYDGDTDGGTGDAFANFSVTLDGTGVFDSPAALLLQAESAASGDLVKPFDVILV